jgi:4-phosphopantoate--beta-alanine ligase
MAEMAAASLLSGAKKPVISVNGNVAALCPESVVELANEIPALLEINLFHRTEERMEKLAKHLKGHGAGKVLGTVPDAKIPGLEHARAICTKAGIYSADVILVPLEDGDRALALREMGKTTIVIDLNPLSRSSLAANITIVDEVTRALPNIVRYVRELRSSPVITVFDNEKNLENAVKRIGERLLTL